MKERSLDGRVCDVAALPGQRVQKTTDREVIWLLDDLSTVREAFRRSAAAIAQRDTFGHLVYFRVLAEAAIRIAWATRFLPDARESRAAVGAMLKRDLIAFQGSSRQTAGKPNAGVAEQIRKLEGKPASPNLERLAAAADISGAYKWFRLCSAMIHPGAGRMLVAGFPSDESQRQATAYTLLSASAVDEAMVALGAYAELTPSIDKVAHDGLLMYSPVVWVARLGRDLRADGSRARIRDASITLREDDEQHWSVTAEAAIVRARTARTYTVTADDPKTAYQWLIAQARSSS